MCTCLWNLGLFERLGTRSTILKLGQEETAEGCYLNLYWNLQCLDPEPVPSAFGSTSSWSTDALVLFTSIPVHHFMCNGKVSFDNHKEHVHTHTDIEKYMSCPFLSAQVLWHTGKYMSCTFLSAQVLWHIGKYMSSPFLSAQVLWHIGKYISCPFLSAQVLWHIGKYIAQVLWKHQDIKRVKARASLRLLQCIHVHHSGQSHSGLFWQNIHNV